MRHPDLNIKNITIKESSAYRVRVESWESINPKGLFSVDIIQECLNQDGDVDSSSTYNFHMTRDEIKVLADGLMSV
jgi:hypothetical protein